MLAPGKAGDTTEVAADIATFMRGASIEATRPDAADIAALQGSAAGRHAGLSQRRAGAPAGRSGRAGRARARCRA